MITLVTLVVILPLCFPRELGALAWVSMAAVRPALLSALLPALAEFMLELGAVAWIIIESSMRFPGRAPVKLSPALT